MRPKKLHLPEPPEANSSGATSLLGDPERAWSWAPINHNAPIGLRVIRRNSNFRKRLFQKKTIMRPKKTSPT